MKYLRCPGVTYRPSADDRIKLPSLDFDYLSPRKERPLRHLDLDLSISESREKRKLPLFLKRRQQMTVCAAAICTVEYQAGGPIRAVIGISDRMLTSMNVEFEPKNTTKIHSLSKSVVGLGAGDSSVLFSVTESTRMEAKGSRIVDVGRIANLHAKNLTAFRKSHLECGHLAVFGLTMDAFISCQNDFVPEIAIGLIDKMSRDKIDADTIVCGVDKSGPHIYQVTDCQEELCQDAAAYCSIGIGSGQFEMTFMSAGYDWSWRLPSALLLMYSAKKKAEAVAGVGKTTDMFIVDEKDGFRLFPVQTVLAIEKHYVAMEKANKKQWEACVKKIASDNQILGKINKP